MTEAAAAPVEYFRKDYLPVYFTADSIYLDFDLSASNTVLTTTTKFIKNPKNVGDRVNEVKDLILNGEEIELVSIAIDGQVVPAELYTNDVKNFLLTIPFSTLSTFAKNIDGNLLLFTYIFIIIIS